MKIDKVILSSNENKEYLDFWPLVAEAWKNLGIEPVLIYTGSKSLEIKGNVIKIKIPLVKSSFVAQNIRLLIPFMFPDDVCIISDIDNMPLSEKYFQNSISQIEDNSFVIYRPNAASENMISIMWNAAKGKIWSQIFGVKSLLGLKFKIFIWYFYFYKFYRYSWYTDQILLRKYVNKFKFKHPNTIIELNDVETKFKRLDRATLDEDINNFKANSIIFSDFHMPRPFDKYKKIIEEVYDKVFRAV